MIGGVPEWPNGADCKSAGLYLRWFESIRPHQCRGSSSVGRAIAFQAIGREFEPRLPLTIYRRQSGHGKYPLEILFVDRF